MRARSILVARQIARNVLAGKRPPAANDLASGAELSAADSAAYAESAYRSLADHGLLATEQLPGARILEVGPGETLALGLRMIAAGAGEVVAVDRFPVYAELARRHAVYEELIERLDGAERERARSAHRAGEDPPLDPARVRLLSGLAAEDAHASLGHASFDFVVSIAALQHTADLRAALESLDRLLSPGGVMAHQVDLGDMGLFSGRGLHPLTFLTVPSRQYRWMGSNLGTPNRELIDTYRRVLEGLGYELELNITKVLGDTEKLDPYRSELVEGRDYSGRHIRLLDDVRPRLLERYRSLPSADLLTQSALIVARKPGRTAGG